MAQTQPSDREAWVAVALAGASIFSMGGVIFGIASLYPVMYYEQALMASSCKAAAASSCVVRSSEKCCSQQQLQYTLMSSIALFVADGAMLLYGELADRSGPRTCFGVGCFLAWLGSLLLACGANFGGDAFWYAATFALGASGPGVFMGCLMLGEKFPGMHGIISAVGASMWDASALVFMIFNAVYFASARDGEPPNVGLGMIAVGWLGVTIPLGVMTWRVLPSKSEVDAIRANSDTVMLTTSTTEDSELTGGVNQDGKGQSEGAEASFLSCFVRKDTCLVLAFMATMNLKSSFFITTFADEALRLFGADSAEVLSTTFNLAFPIGGFITSILASMMLQRLARREDLYMLVVVLLCLAFGLLNLIPIVPTQMGAALLFGPTRTTQWACYFHLLSLPQRYPPQFVGRLLGYGNLVIALAGDIPVYLLNAFVTNTNAFHSAGSRYIFVHALLELLMVAGLALPWHLNRTLQGRPQCQNKHLPPGTCMAPSASEA